jgi:hypothetical protein
MIFLQGIVGDAVVALDRLDRNVKLLSTRYIRDGGLPARAGEAAIG